MTRTFGTAPFTRPPGRVYNFDFEHVIPEHILYLEPVPKRRRGQVAGETLRPF